MPRIRSVHPDICQSETMARLSAELERTFVRLWTHCDDEGRCEDRPRILKASLYPEHDDVTPDQLDEELVMLEQDGLILRYVVDGKKLIQVVSWAEYQKPQRPRPSKYASPPVPVREPSAMPPDNARTGVEREIGEGVVVGEGDMAPTEPALPANGRRDMAIATKHLKRLEPVLASGSSFDLVHEFRELWGPAWQEAIDAGITPTSVGRNLLATFIATVTDTDPDYGRAGQLVGKFGKLALLGIDEGIIHNADDPYTYAFKVCQNQAANQRAEVAT